MLQVSTLQSIIDRAAYQYWQTQYTANALASGTTFMLNIRYQDSNTLVALVKSFDQADDYTNDMDRHSESVYKPMVNALESHARANGETSFADWTSGLVANGNLVIDEGFANIWEACRAPLADETITVSGIRAVHL